MEEEDENNGLWWERSCTLSRSPICQKPAVKGHDPRPQPTPPPPSEECEVGWFYMTSTGTCCSIDHLFVATWDAAESNCKGLGGNLVSVNSPYVQEELQRHLNDPDATGKFL